MYAVNAVIYMDSKYEHCKNEHSGVSHKDISACGEEAMDKTTTVLSRRGAQNI